MFHLPHPTFFNHNALAHLIPAFVINHYKTLLFAQYHFGTIPFLTHTHNHILKTITRASIIILYPLALPSHHQQSSRNVQLLWFIYACIAHNIVKYLTHWKLVFALRSHFHMIVSALLTFWLLFHLFSPCTQDTHIHTHAISERLWEWSVVQWSEILICI